MCKNNSKNWFLARKLQAGQRGTKILVSFVLKNRHIEIYIFAYKRKIKKKLREKSYLCTVLVMYQNGLRPKQRGRFIKKNLDYLT
ncbi:MAG: hypothetical protein RLZZ628_484 [Bacteroidota bacterium]